MKIQLNKKLPKKTKEIFVFTIFIILSASVANMLLDIDKYHVKLFIFGSLTYLFLIFITLIINVFNIDNYVLKLGFHRMFFL